MRPITLSCLGTAMAALCVNAAAAQDGPPAFAPPPGVAAQINLGTAGLLPSFYSNEIFGTAQGRIGQSRATYGAAEAPGAPQDGYEDEASSLVTPMTGLQALPDGKSYIRYTLAGTLGDGSPNPVELDGRFGRLDVQYMTFPNPDTMYAFGVVLGMSTVDIVGSGVIDKKEAGFRGDVIHKFSANWGVAARAEYVWGEAEKKIDIAPGMVLEQSQGDDRFYTQAELVGTFDGQSGLAPQGWVFRPILGANFQRNFIEETENSFGVAESGVNGDTEDYGTVWGKIGLQKQARPGEWSPMVAVGLEHEWVNSLDAYIDEPDYAIASLGAAMVTKGGAGIVLNYTRHQGLNDHRSNQSFTAALTVPF